MSKRNPSISRKHKRGSIALTLLLFSIIMMTLFGVFMKYSVGEISTQEALIVYQQKNIDRENLKKITQEAVLQYYEKVGWDNAQTIEELINAKLTFLNDNGTFTFELDDGTANPTPDLPSNDTSAFWPNINTADTSTSLSAGFSLSHTDNTNFQSHRLVDSYLIGSEIYAIRDDSDVSPEVFEFNYKKEDAAGVTIDEITINIEIWQVASSDFQVIAYSIADGTFLNHIPTVANVPNCPTALSNQIAAGNVFAILSSGINADSPASSATSAGLNLPYYYRNNLSATSIVWNELWNALYGTYYSKYQTVSNVVKLYTADTDRSDFLTDNAHIVDSSDLEGITLSGNTWIVDIEKIDNTIQNLLIETDESDPVNNVQIIQSTDTEDRINPIIIYTKHYTPNTRLNITLASDIEVNTAIFCDQTNLVLGNAHTNFTGSIFLSPNSQIIDLATNSMNLTGSLALSIHNFPSTFENITFIRNADTNLKAFVPRFLVTHAR